MSCNEKPRSPKRQIPVSPPQHDFYMPAMPPFWLFRALRRGVRKLFSCLK
ncbi:hypothetical protein SAMN05216256_110141 [Halopseudomonas pachastrellae]|nr:hypothetical protein SAMN05216256_110141 [Halopseudomonas pachastrellae]